MAVSMPVQPAWKNKLMLCRGLQESPSKTTLPEYDPQVSPFCFCPTLLGVSDANT